MNASLHAHDARGACMSHVLLWGEAVLHFNAQDNMQKVRYVLVHTLRALLVDVGPHNAARFEPVIQHILRAPSTESAMRQALQEARTMCSNAVQQWIYADEMGHIDAHGVPAYTAAHDDQEVEEPEEQHAWQYSELDLYREFCSNIGSHCYGRDLSYVQWRNLPHVQREREIRNEYRRQNGIPVQ
jgi:Rad3-related DNA helicase